MSASRSIWSSMPLAAGTRLGPYEIVAPIGAGGMGQVYRARDTKLNRDVALKILPDAFASDPDRLARFIREAQTLASLNHPNIAIIHGLEQAGDLHALVMELVEGDDLSQRIARGAIPIDEALPIAKQIAEALEAAHEQGIIHRDLKPANIKVREDCSVSRTSARFRPRSLHASVRRFACACGRTRSNAQATSATCVWRWRARSRRRFPERPLRHPRSSRALSGSAPCLWSPRPSS